MELNNPVISTFSQKATKNKSSSTIIYDEFINSEILSSQEEAYLNSLTEKEYKAYKIAKNCLGSSFNLKKSNGFLTYVTKLKDYCSEV